MLKHNLLMGAATILAIVPLSGAAHANTIFGSIWENVESISTNATIANKPSTTPNVTFTAPDPLAFQSGSLYTIGEFLSSGNGSTVLTGSGELGNTLDNTYFYFSGNVTVTNGETYTVGHDDGLQLEIGGDIVINEPGPTSFANTTYTWTGPSGNYAFQLSYGENSGPPADLFASLPFTSGVPEPSTWAMMGLGFAGLGFVGSRRARKTAMSIA
jgi:hypothetical protein